MDAQADLRPCCSHTKKSGFLATGQLFYLAKFFNCMCNFYMLVFTLVDVGHQFIYIKNQNTDVSCLSWNALGIKIADTSSNDLVN